MERDALIEHTCLDCSIPLTDENWPKSYRPKKKYYCFECYNTKHNSSRMFVNGKYVSRKHPLWKAGRYIIDGFFGEAMVESGASRSGYIYCITNPAHPGWVKVGKAVDIDKRFNSYQTYSPHRDFKLEWFFHVEDMDAVEHSFHKGRKAKNGEWYQMGAMQALSIIQAIPQVGGTNAEEDHRVAHDTVDQGGTHCGGDRVG